MKAWSRARRRIPVRTLSALSMSRCWPSLLLCIDLLVVWVDSPFAGAPKFLAGKIKLGPGGVLPPTETVVEDNTKKVTTYTRLEDGKIEKKTSIYKIEVRKAATSKKTQERRKWTKFGDAAGLAPGPDSGSTTISDDVYLSLKSKKEVQDTGEKEESLASKLTGVRIVSCRICKGDHWTTKCPYKDSDMLSALKTADEPGEEDTQDGDGGDTGKPVGGRYRPPGMRGERGAGESMNQRDDTATVRVNNLSENTREEDLRVRYRVCVVLASSSGCAPLSSSCWALCIRSRHERVLELRGSPCCAIMPTMSDLANFFFPDQHRNYSSALALCKGAIWPLTAKQALHGYVISACFCPRSLLCGFYVCFACHPSYFSLRRGWKAFFFPSSLSAGAYIVRHALLAPLWLCLFTSDLLISVVPFAGLCICQLFPQRGRCKGH